MNWTVNDLKAALTNNPALAYRNPKVVKEMENTKDTEDKGNKFNAKSGWLDGHYFPSQAEMNRYCELKILKAAGVIKDFWCQPKFELQAGLTYRPDFEVEYFDHIEYEEVKGKWTADARMRVKLFREKYSYKILKIIRNKKVIDE